MGISLGGLALFAVLESQRRSPEAPAVRAASAATFEPPPTLYVPPAPVVELPAPKVAPVRPAMPTPSPASAQPSPVIQPAQPYQPYPQPVLPEPVAAQPQPQRNSGSPILVIDQGGRRANQPSANNGGEAEGGAAAGVSPASQRPDTSRARAGAFANRATTIVQGSLIPAVLESALDSTRPGFARAIVSRDVYSFDGSRVLVPKGSRLIGEYETTTAPGQNRALVIWSRLIRPDGATIAIASPVADTLGRTGVRARVDTHFLERFGGAILQSMLNIGSNLAARAVDSPTVIALPGSFSGAVQTVQPSQVTPTLTVRPGTSISVFVVRDLDFTGVEQDR
ncbi:TrbI/VirB10 family protein [Sphingomonas sp. CJ99]